MLGNTKEVKDDKTEVESSIWDNAEAGVMGGGFISERHGILFESLMKRMTSLFKTNFLNSFIRYMEFSHGVSVGKDSYEKELKIDKDHTSVLEALIQVGRASFWCWYDGSSILLGGEKSK